MDNLFKSLLIIILVAFLYLYYENSGSGRYIDYSKIKGQVSLLDTKTGKVYFYGIDRVLVYSMLSQYKSGQIIKDE